MNKSEMVDNISADTGLSKTSTTSAFDSVIKNIEETFKKGQSVEARSPWLLLPSQPSGKPPAHS